MAAWRRAIDSDVVSWRAWCCATAWRWNFGARADGVALGDVIDRSSVERLA